MADDPGSQSGDDHRYNQLEARIADMEMRLTFQDDLLSALNDQVAHQEQALQRVWDTNRILREQIKNLREPQLRDAAEESLPPHY
jgi:SlyX protein